MLYLKTMRDLFAKYGIELNNEQVDKFEKFFDLLTFYNKKFNLTAITEKQDVFIKHFLDSSIGAEKLYDKVIDIGAGGGFPSIPIKIMNPEVNMTMLEATGKKCEFLRTVIKELDLKNTEVICGRAEEVAKEEKYREKFDFAVSRAVARLNVLCEYDMPFVKVGGTFVAYKGDAEEEIKEAKNAIDVLGGRLDYVFTFDLEGACRMITYIKKIKNTDSKYPRGNGKERKSPL